MQMFENLPWYGYVILAVGIASYAYKYFRTAKESYDEANLKNAKFKTDKNSSLSREQQFALAFYTPIAEWWGADVNTLNFLNAKKVAPYLEGWGISDKAGYWDLTNYFTQDGRRGYFDFITAMLKNEPEEKWEALMAEKFGANERAERYFDLLKSGKTVDKLKQKGFITFDSEIETGVAGYDAAVLVGQARKAYTANIITEEEAWKVIDFANSLALKHCSSWEEFGKSFVLGFDLDMRASYKTYKEEVFHMFNQTVERLESPWNTISWPK